MDEADGLDVPSTTPSLDTSDGAPRAEDGTRRGEEGCDCCGGTSESVITDPIGRSSFPFSIEGIRASLSISATATAISVPMCSRMRRGSSRRTEAGLVMVEWRMMEMRNAVCM